MLSRVMYLKEYKICIMPQMKTVYVYVHTKFKNLTTSLTHSLESFARKINCLTGCVQNRQSCSAGCVEIDLRSCSQMPWTFDWCCCCSSSGRARGRDHRWCCGLRALLEPQSLGAASEAALDQMLQRDGLQAPVLQKCTNIVNLQ